MPKRRVPVTRKLIQSIQRFVSGDVCIYCRSPWPPDSVDHVVPRLLGTFQHNWTLSCVCDRCNNFLSQFELPLGRGSVEGFLRVDLGVRPPQAAADFQLDRMAFRVANQGSQQGYRLVPTADGSALVPGIVAQVGFRRPDDNEWTFLTEAELTPQSVAPFSGIPVEVRCIVPHGLGFDSLLQRLASLNIHIQETYRNIDERLGTPGEPLTVDHDFKIDKLIQRAVGKIAFNYLTKVLGPETARHHAFDTFRNFVRYGDQLVPLCSISERGAFSILVGDGADESRAHSCGIGWTEGHGLIGLVTLFNEVRYGFRLCSRHHVEYRNLRRHHLFDPFAHTITELGIAE